MTELLGLISFITGFIWLCWMIQVSYRLGKIRDEAKKQTALLEEIAAQGRSKPGPGSSVRYE